MAEERVVVAKKSLTDIADSVRAVTGSTERMLLSSLPSEIQKVQPVQLLARREITSYSDAAMEYVPKYAFYNCFSLKKVDLPKVTMLEEGAFAYSGVTDETVNVLLKNVTQLGGNDFQGCGYLKNVTSKLTGSWSFANCSALTSFDNSETEQYSAGYNCFKGSTNLKKFLFGGRYMSSYTGFETDGMRVWLSSNCTSLAANIFTNCKNLKIYLEASTTPTAFTSGWDTTADGTATVAYGVTKETFNALP